jgi:hypothetical protein
LLRIRSDCDFASFFTGELTPIVYLGVYIEKSFGKNRYSGYSAGVSVEMHAALIAVPFVLLFRKMSK